MTPNLAKVRRTLEKRIKVEVDHSLKELRNGHEGAAAYHRDQASIYRSRLFHLDSGLQPFELRREPFLFVREPVGDAREQGAVQEEHREQPEETLPALEEPLEEGAKLAHGASPAGCWLGSGGSVVCSSSGAGGGGSGAFRTSST